MASRKTVALATEIRYALNDILRRDLGCVGVVSHAVCHDVIVRHLHDMDRLYAVHQALVHPTKHVGYLAFWIRKLKPVSSAFQNSSVEAARQEQRTVEPFEEVADINEKISLHYALELLIMFIREGKIAPPKSRTPEEFADKVRTCFRSYLDAPVIEAPFLSKRFDQIIYDMRFRTFGPHHMVHIMNHLLREANHND